MDCVIGAINACRTEQVSFEIGCQGGVGVDRSKMRREGVPNRGASRESKPRGFFPGLENRVFKSLGF